MASTDSLLEVMNQIEAYVIAGQSTLGLKKVWVGDDDALPEMPSVTIAPGAKTREIQETGHTVINRFPVYLTILHARLDSTQTTLKESIALSEALEDYLHEDKRLNGLIVYSYVRSVEPGVTTRQRALVRATRLLWEGMSKTRI